MRAAVWLLVLWTGATAACPLDHAARTGTVRAITDGDTLTLTDRTRVRLLGLDAPELAHPNQREEPLARTARTRLETLAPPGTVLRLRTDAQDHDRYGRLLAHAYLPDGRNLSAELLRAGLGELLVLAPNVWQADCLADAETQARRARRGVWALPGHRVQSAAQVAVSRPAFAVVRGRVTAVKPGRRGTSLTLDDRITLWVPHAVRQTLPGPALTARTGQTVTARGMLYPRGKSCAGGGNIVVRHRATLEWQP